MQICNVSLAKVTNKATLMLQGPTVTCDNDNYVTVTHTEPQWVFLSSTVTEKLCAPAVWCSTIIDRLVCWLQICPQRLNTIDIRPLRVSAPWWFWTSVMSPTCSCTRVTGVTLLVVLFLIRNQYRHILSTSVCQRNFEIFVSSQYAVLIYVNLK